MIITLFDKTELYATKQQADRLKKMLGGSAKFATIDGVTFALSAVAKITPGGEPVVEPWTTPNLKRLNDDSRTPEQQYQAARSAAESVRNILKRKGLKGIK